MEKRIRKQFTKELENIKKGILALGALVDRIARDQDAGGRDCPEKSRLDRAPRARCVFRMGGV